MITVDNETWNQDDFTPVLDLFAHQSDPIMFVFDVDCTLIGAFREDQGGFNVRPGAVETLRMLHERGHELWLWSAGGANHCAEVAAQLGIEDLLQGWHTKPPFPMSLHRNKVVEKFGRFPDVSVDDDEGERVSSVLFVKVTQFWGDIEGL